MSDVTSQGPNPSEGWDFSRFLVSADAGGATVQYMTLQDPLMVPETWACFGASGAGQDRSAAPQPNKAEKFRVAGRAQQFVRVGRDGRRGEMPCSVAGPSKHPCPFLLRQHSLHDIVKAEVYHPSLTRC
jgi:hypothetical protein